MFLTKSLIGTRVYTHKEILHEDLYLREPVLNTGKSSIKYVGLSGSLIVIVKCRTKRRISECKSGCELQKFGIQK